MRIKASHKVNVLKEKKGKCIKCIVIIKTKEFLLRIYNQCKMFENKMSLKTNGVL